MSLQIAKRLLVIVTVLFVSFTITACGGGETDTGFESIHAVEIGGILQFGGYDWRVLDIDGSYALILHETVIENHPYHYAFGDVTWETSSVREWLNEEFYNEFAVDDRERIRKTYVINNDNPWEWEFGFANTPGGANTDDKIFLLSIDEVTRYFGDSGMVARGALPDELRIATWPDYGVFWWGIHDEYSTGRISRNSEGNASWWWLRSPGGSPTYAAYVGLYGELRVEGGRTYIMDSWVGIRPALWLNIEA